MNLACKKLINTIIFMSFICSATINVGPGETIQDALDVFGGVVIK